LLLDDVLGELKGVRRNDDDDDDDKVESVTDASISSDVERRDDNTESASGDEMRLSALSSSADALILKVAAATVEGDA
jgi:hypothetical protein